MSKEEIRCLIGQKTGLRFLLPIAVDILKNEPLIDITYFEGDLLLTLLRLEKSDWEYNQGISKNLPFCFSSKSKRAMCGASPRTPTSKNIVFRGSHQNELKKFITVLQENRSQIEKCEGF